MVETIEKPYFLIGNALGMERARSAVLTPNTATVVMPDGSKIDMSITTDGKVTITTIGQIVLRSVAANQIEVSSEGPS